MAAHPRQTVTDHGHDVGTPLCTINPTGVVFSSAERLDISSELGLVIETDVLGMVQEWAVQGWVVACKETGTQGEPFEITLLFSEVPVGLRQILALSPTAVSALMPRLGSDTRFGLN